jgi:hypothetical protein
MICSMDPYSELEKLCACMHIYICMATEWNPASRLLNLWERIQFKNPGGPLSQESRIRQLLCGPYICCAVQEIFDANMPKPHASQDREEAAQLDLFHSTSDGDMGMFFVCRDMRPSRAAETVDATSRGSACPLPSLLRQAEATRKQALHIRVRATSICWAMLTRRSS